MPPAEPASSTVRELAALAGLALPEEDVAPLAALLAGHAALVAPLLELDLGDTPSALDLDPRWP
jgi:hypothetical protein